MYNLKREIFKEFYKSKGFKQPDIAKGIGVSLDTVKSWTRTGSTTSPDEGNIKALAKFLQCKIEDIAEIDKEFKNLSIIKAYDRPIIGEASCGVPTTYYYDYGEYEMESAPEWAGERAYYIKADGDSMEPDIMNGSLVLCDPDAEVIEGKFVHYTWDGENGIKKYINLNGQVILQPINQNHPPILVTDAYELRMVRCVFVGKSL